MTGTAARVAASRLPPAVAVATYVLLTGVLIALGLKATGGRLVFALDDPYIHLALARNLADQGVWGIRPGAFAPVSSSPAWTILLTLVRFAGGSAVWWPLALNVAAGIGLIMVLDAGVRTRLSLPARVGLLTAVVLAAPLPTLALTGMEHSLQLVLLVPLALRMSRHLAEPQFDGWFGTCALAAAATATRYEDLFLVAAFAACLLWTRRPGSAGLVLTSAFLPVAMYGLFAVSQGGALLPNSLLMKSGFSAGAGWPGIWRMAELAVSVPQLWWRRDQIVLTALVAAMLGSRKQGSPTTLAEWFAALFLMTSVEHFALVRLQWFFRYEAYVVTLGVIAAVLLVRERYAAHAGRSAAVLPWLIIPATVLGLRAWQGASLAPQACAEIYSQQVQLAEFADRYYPHETIAINDIGAVSYYSTSGIFDIAGLATPEVAAARRAGHLDAARLDTLMAAGNVKAVAMYTGVYGPLVNPGWCRAGSWTIGTHVAASERSIDFFARNREDCQALREILRQARDGMPLGVVVRVADAESR